MKTLSVSFLLVLLFVCSCDPKPSGSTLFEGFHEPPAEARPFVRWWWNGNQLEDEEIIRQIELLHQAGMGGVEINPIAMAAENPDIGLESLEWMSPAWNAMLALASKELKSRGMIADLIVGSGWPFGGEFLEPDEMIQRMLVEHVPVKGPGEVKRDSQQMIMDVVIDHRDGDRVEVSNELMFIRLVPIKAGGVSEVVDLMGNFRDGSLRFQVPEGEFELIFGILQTGHREVMHGTPGAAGPVMNHYDAEVVMDYLNRLKKIEEDTGIPLRDLVRALFCDSIELAGANWTKGFGEIFEETYGYSLTDYLPFLFYQPYAGYEQTEYSKEFGDELKRVRYDYNKLLVKVFLDNFTRTFHRFCEENNLLSRYQAYGTPFLMDMLEGYMIPHIPESNNWVFSADMNMPDWQWNKGHGYMVWNMYTAAGGHLSGRKIISTEAMTNTQGVFKLTLEDMKQADDMNFITGMNHSVLHGYNYSPPEAGFPGWIRYGAYYSEQNTWWPYLRNWVDYNARVSYVLQNSQPVKQIAVLPPVADIWSERGLIRVPFHMEPWYMYELWESFSQAGSSVEYINERVIREGEKEKGQLRFGPMNYHALIIAGVGSMELETARSVADYVESGGKLVIMDSIPARDPRLQHEENDQKIKDIFRNLVEQYPEKVYLSGLPVDSDNLPEWTMELIGRLELPLDVEILNPDEDVYQLHQVAGKEEIFFFVNSHRAEDAVLDVIFRTPGRNLWHWNPEDGTRRLLGEIPRNGKVQLELAPLESQLLLISDEQGEVSRDIKVNREEFIPLEGPWELQLQHADGTNLSLKMNELTEFSTSGNPELESFAGTAVYKTMIDPQDRYTVLDLGEVNRSVTGVYLNGKKVGERWYGRHTYNLSEYLSEEDNRLEIHLTTTLSNYTRTLRDNPVARRWGSHDPVEAGLEGPVKMIKTIE